MQTHHDAEHEDRQARELRERLDDLKDLEAEAERMTEEGENVITAGEDGEEPIAEWGKFGVRVTQYPVREIDAPLDILRISLGQVGDGTGYCVFRGDINRAIHLLTQAKNALKRRPRDG